MIKTKENRRGGGKSLSFLMYGWIPRASAIGRFALVAAVLCAAATAQAADVNWTGATDTSWTTKSNWSSGSVPTSDNLLFDSKNFKQTFTNNNLTVVFPDARTLSWKLNANNCGASNKRLIFKGANAAAGLTVGTTTTSDTYSRGFHIADDSTPKGAYIRFDTGTFATKCSANVWNLGGSKGWANVEVVNGATIDSPGAFYLNNGSLTLQSGTVTASKDFIIGANTSATLTINDGTVSVGGNGGWLNFQSAAGDKNINLNGGTLKAYVIKNAGGSAAKKIFFNGGTLFANSVHPTQALVDSGIAVTVKARGGTINANGYNVTVTPSVNEDSSSTGGGMTFCGGGSVTLVNGAAYTGATTVEVGTALKIPTADDLCGTLVVTAPASIADGVHTLVALTGDGATFADDSAISGVTVPADCTLRISDNRKAIEVVKGAVVGHWTGDANDNDLDNPLNWSDGRTPSGYPAYITVGAGAAPLVHAANGAFAPSSITFTEGCESATLNGADITNIVAVTNLSAASHTINAKVYFAGDIKVKQAATAEVDDLGKAHVTFTGGAYAAEGSALESGNGWADYSRCIFGEYFLAPAANNPWTAQYQGSGKRVCVADNATLHIPYAGALTELYVGNGAKVYVGNATLDNDQRLSWHNYGEVVVSNLSTAATSGNRYVSYNQGTSTPGVFKLESVTNSMTSNWFYLSDKNAAASHVFYIGEGGLNFANASGDAAYCLGLNKDGNSETIRPWYSDFTIAGRGDSTTALVLYRNVEFCTDDESGTGRTITIDGVTRGNGTSAAITVSGSGKLKATKMANNADQPTVTVTDTATLAFKPGASFGTGKTTVNSGAALEVAESGKVTLGGNLDLKGGATLKFKFTERRNQPVLDVTGKEVTFGSATNIQVSVVGERPAYYGVPGGNGKYALTSGFDFKAAGAMVAKAADCADWVKSFSFDSDGNIVADIPCKGFLVIVN